MAESEMPPPPSRRRGAMKGLPWIFEHLQTTRPPPGQQYRESTLGRTLQESIDELVTAGKLTESLGKRIMLHFDVHTAAHLQRCGTQAKFTTSGMPTFKEVSQNYDFVVNDVEFSARGRSSYNVSVGSMRVKAVPSTKLIKKNALKKSRKGAVQDTEKSKDEASLYEVMQGDDDDVE